MTGTGARKRMMRILCAIALVFLGLGNTDTIINPGLALEEAYRLPDGSFASLCLADEAHDPADPSKHCSACTLVIAHLGALPEAIVVPQQAFRSLDGAVATLQSTLERQLSSHIQSRGPPEIA